MPAMRWGDQPEAVEGCSLGGILSRVPGSRRPRREPGSGGAAQLSREYIEKLAYQYWLNRGCRSGSAEKDWYQAERALMAEAEMDRGEVQPLAGAVMRAGG